MTAAIEASPGAKMIYLIKRKASTSREELVAHWYANHMPSVIRNQVGSAERGQRHATRYIATLFDAGFDVEGRGGADEDVQAWDGMAQLWWDAPLNMPKVPHGTKPTDSFQERAEPYLPWATSEFVAMDGELPVTPLTLNEPFPTTRSGFYKQVFLVAAKPGTDYLAFFEHWLSMHVPKVRERMEQVGGFRYCVSLSQFPDVAPYAGLAELWFPNRSCRDDYVSRVTPDGMETWVDVAATQVYGSQTEMIGIP